MATNRQDVLKEGTVEGAADRLARNRENAQREAVDREPLPEVLEDTQEAPIEEMVEAPEELEAPVPEEVAPSLEDDLFADDLEEDAPRTLDAPAAFSKDGKDLFAEADPALQQEISARLKAAERGATQKVEQVSQKEKELEQLAEQVLAMRQQLQERLESVSETLPEPPDPLLADVNSESYDPDRFNVQLARYERAKRDAELNAAERQKLATEQQAIAEQQQNEQHQQHARQIVKTFPKWNTTETFTKGVSSVQQYFVDRGTPRDVAVKITDPVAIEIGYKAMKYDEIKGKMRKPAPLRAAKPSGRGSRTKQTSNAKQLDSTFRQTGTVEDAAALLSATHSKRR